MREFYCHLSLCSRIFPFSFAGFMDDYVYDGDRVLVHVLLRVQPDPHPGPQGVLQMANWFRHGCDQREVSAGIGGEERENWGREE